MPTTQTRNRTKRARRSEEAIAVCVGCNRTVYESDEYTDAYSELRGVCKVHRRCAGRAQDALDQEFCEFEDGERGGVSSS